MKHVFHRLMAKFIIKWLSDVRHESTLKVLIHAILKEMQRLNTEELEITYTAEVEGKHYCVVTRSILKEGGL